MGQPVAGDSIFNGAMDNASGIATLIETAEEKGLLGSDYFAGHPTVPEGGVLVANLNTDMFLPINPLRRLLVNGRSATPSSEAIGSASSAAEFRRFP